MNFWRKKKIEKEAEEASIDVVGPVLRIVVGSSHVANLFHDGTDYCLEYLPAFSSSGLVAFNPNDVLLRESPKIHHVYRSPILWQVFASRMPAEGREDYRSLLSKYSLTGKEHPLLILGRVGRVSISKPWKLELVPGKAS